MSAFEIISASVAPQTAPTRIRFNGRFAISNNLFFRVSRSMAAGALCVESSNSIASNGSDEMGCRIKKSE